MHRNPAHKHKCEIWVHCESIPKRSRYYPDFYVYDYFRLIYAQAGGDINVIIKYVIILAYMLNITMKMEHTNVKKFI
jgi:hypothetical protein